MGLFHKGTFPGLIEPESLEDGLPGRGVLNWVEGTGTYIHSGTQACKFKVEVTLDKTPAYNAEVIQEMAVSRIQQLQNTSIGTTVAVRVDPADHTRVAIFFGTEPPTFEQPT